LILALALTALPGMLSATGEKSDTKSDPGTETKSDPTTESEGAASSSETLLLEVEINGQSTGKIGEFILRRGKLMARADELRDLGFLVPDSQALSPQTLISLSDLPGLTWSLDEKNLVLHVSVNDSRLSPTLLRPEGRDRLEEHRVIESGSGVTLNYGIVNTFASGQAGATGSMDLRAFSPAGVVSSGWLAYAGTTTGPSAKNQAIRLDSAYSFADVNSLRQYSLGDFITNGLAWTRPVRLEGAQIRSDFSMRPDLITFPMPTITGSAAVPSTVNVLADGNVVVSSQIAPGPFEIPQLPVVSGAGTISMTVTNALGQQVTLNQPFYASSALLAPGLQTFATEAGLARRNWGTASFDYGKIAGAATYRRGLTRKFTLEGTVEGTPGAFMGGGGGVLQVANLGVLNFAGAASAGSGPGGQVSVGAQRIGRVFSLGASAMLANRNYRDIASMNGAGIPRRQISGFASLSLRRFGSIGGAYAGIDQDPAPVTLQFEGTSPQHSHVVSANYSFQFHNMSFYASEFIDFAATSNSSGLQVGLTIPFGRRRSADIGGTSDGSGQVQVQQSAAEIGQWGYHAYASFGSSNHEFAEVQYKSPVGLFAAGVDTTGGQTTLRLESQGALSFADRGLFPSNTIYDSFAIVDTAPMPHVRVFQENRDVGSTGSSGRLLVPDMRAFDLNHITIEATDLPADVTIHDSARVMRPQDRSGVVVKFPIKFSHGALLRLVDQQGNSIPLGSSATLHATGIAVPVGYDGDAYLEDLSPRNQLTVERPDGRRCTVAFDYQAVPGDIPSIGPLTCLETKP
jgi:outer membrane usher protein